MHESANVCLGSPQNDLSNIEIATFTLLVLKPVDIVRKGTPRFSKRSAGAPPGLSRRHTNQMNASWQSSEIPTASVGILGGGPERLSRPC